MSGIIGSKINIRGSGRIAKLGTDGQVLTSGGAGVAANYEDIAGGISWQAIETGSTMTAVAGEAYWVDTTSNACTITLPGSASVGDTIIFADYARTWGTNGIVIDSNGLNYQSDDDTYDVEYGTDGMALSITYMDATQGWVPTFDQAVTNVPSKGNTYGIVAFGYTAAGLAATAVSNLISSAGVVSSDVSGVGTARWALGATQYGGDKGIFAYGYSPAIGQSSLSNLVSNAGVVATDTTGVGTQRSSIAACSYGGDKGIFSYGNISLGDVSNLVSNTGVVAADVANSGTMMQFPGATEYGTDTAIFAFGTPNGGYTNISHLVTNLGVIGGDVSGVGTARVAPCGASYGYDKGIIWGGDAGPVTNVSNLISDAGVVATDTAGVGTARAYAASCEYLGGKAIIVYGATSVGVQMSNLISNAGVVATDTAGVGTARQSVPGCSYG